MAANVFYTYSMVVVERSTNSCNLMGGAWRAARRQTELQVVLCRILDCRQIGGIMVLGMNGTCMNLTDIYIALEELIWWWTCGFPTVKENIVRQSVS